MSTSDTRELSDDAVKSGHGEIGVAWYGKLRDALPAGMDVSFR